MAKLDRAAELRFMFDVLKDRLAGSAEVGGAEGSGAAAIVREMRLLSAELEVIDKSGKAVSKVDEVAARREAKAGAPGPPSRRRNSG